MSAIIPGHSGQQNPHSAEIGDSGKNQSRADKSRQPKERRMNKPAQERTCRSRLIVETGAVAMGNPAAIHAPVPPSTTTAPLVACCG
jgi:hypothetical protein